MATPSTTPHPLPVFQVQPHGEELAHARTETLFKGSAVELVRLVVRAGQQLPAHRAPGELVVQCIEGRVEFTARGESRRLEPGNLLHLADGEEHALHALQDSSLLLTICRPTSRPAIDEVEEASEESFPASDPPAWTGSTTG